MFTVLRSKFSFMYYVYSFTYYVDSFTFKVIYIVFYVLSITCTFCLQAEIVMKQKMELINQIKEMESDRSIRQRLVDLTETSGCGLLCEMSIAEVRTGSRPL